MEESKKVPKFLIIVIVVAVLALIGVISNLGSDAGGGDQPASKSQAQAPDIEKTLDGIKASADQTFFYEVSDGSINGFNVVSIKKYDSYTAGTEKVVNAIVIETDGVRDSVEEFLTDKAYVTSCTKDGKAKDDYDSGVWSNDDKTYCVFYSDSSVADQAYIALGGFASEKNKGNSVFVFEIE